MNHDVWKKILYAIELKLPDLKAGGLTGQPRYIALHRLWVYMNMMLTSTLPLSLILYKYNCTSESSDYVVLHKIFSLLTYLLTHLLITHSVTVIYCTTMQY
jgi:hypothetical protein